MGRISRCRASWLKSCGMLIKLEETAFSKPVGEAI